MAVRSLRHFNIGICMECCCMTPAAACIGPLLFGEYRCVRSLHNDDSSAEQFSPANVSGNGCYTSFPVLGIECLSTTIAWFASHWSK